jgi:hypothetical protein
MAKRADHDRVKPLRLTLTESLKSEWEQQKASVKQMRASKPARRDALTSGEQEWQDL